MVMEMWRSLEAPSSDVVAGDRVLELRHLSRGRQSSHLIMTSVAVLYSLEGDGRRTETIFWGLSGICIVFLKRTLLRLRPSI